VQEEKPFLSRYATGCLALLQTVLPPAALAGTVHPDSALSDEDDHLMQVMRRIVDAQWQVKYPPYMSAAAKDLIQRLLERKPGRRIGMLMGGAGDIKAHTWFEVNRLAGSVESCRGDQPCRNRRKHCLGELSP